MATPLGGGQGASGSPVSQTPSDTTLRRASKAPIHSKSHQDGSGGDKPMTTKSSRQQHKEAPPPHFAVAGSHGGGRHQVPVVMDPGAYPHQVHVPTMVYPTGDSRQSYLASGENPTPNAPMARRDDQPHQHQRHPHAHQHQHQHQQHHMHPAAVHGYTSADPSQYMGPHAIATSIPPDSVRYGDQTAQYPAMRPAMYPPQIYYTSTMGAEFTVDPNQPPVFTATGMPAARTSTFPGQAVYHAAATTATVGPQTAWPGSAMTQPFYGSFPALATAPPQHAAPQPPLPEELARQNSVFVPPGTGWSPSTVMSTPYQFYNVFQSSPQVDKHIDPLSPSTDAWSPNLTGPGSSQPGGPMRRGSAVPQPSWPPSISVPSVRPPQSSAPGDEGPKSPPHAGGPERERKDYHPQPPARRSEWVMWVGNVPSNVSHEELWRFFSNTVPPPSSPNDQPWRGPSSIFLISRSSCAFVNFSSQIDLDRAVPYFNGLSLRPWDSRCPRMVCRVRHKDDDLRSGVGAQRGVGMHRAWVEQRRAELSENQPPRRMPTIGVSPKSMSLELPPQPHQEGSQHDSSSAHKSSASYASTNSSFLVHHFPERYFILKSLSAADLQESVKTGLWKTQRHNQPILDQAFRTSKDVYLIFGANRTGEFFGYAKMTGASRKHKPASERAAPNRGSYQSARSSILGLSTSPGQPAPIREEEEKEGSPTKETAGAPAAPAPAPELLSPTAHRSATYQPRSQTDPFLLGGHLAPGLDERRATSPGMIPVEEETEQLVEQVTVEHVHAEQQVGPFIEQHDELHTQHIIPRSESPDLMDESVRRMSTMTLDPNILRGERADSRIRLLSVEHSNSLQVFSRRENTVEGPKPGRQSTLAVPGTQPSNGSSGSEAGDNSLAQPFRVQWIKVAPLSFSRTRHLRNPWNGDREVKVSRDGTEVEPGVGAALLAEWDKLDQPAKADEGKAKAQPDQDKEIKADAGAPGAAQPEAEPKQKQEQEQKQQETLEKQES